MPTHPKPVSRAVGAQLSTDTLAPLDRRWRLRYLLLAPHRLAFFLAAVVLSASAIWWALVQLVGSVALITVPFVIPPVLVHSAVMVFGFMPLFFGGFMFTAVPKWLRMPPPANRQLLVPWLLQTVGWLLWLLGAHLQVWLAALGLVFVCVGLLRITHLFLQLIIKSAEGDRLHAKALCLALAVGCVSLSGVLLGVALRAFWLAQAFVLTGLWGFVLVVYITVAHRMIPFFTSSAMPLGNSRRPFWALHLMWMLAAMEMLAVWIELGASLRGLLPPSWLIGRGIFELLVGGILLWLSAVWGALQSLKNRLLAMLHIGFLWLGLAVALSGFSQLLSWQQGTPVLRLGALHALTMGCLASLMLAMVTRISCAHTGRALVADQLVWRLFLGLQVATLLRILATIPSGFAAWLLLLAAVLWVMTVGIWSARLADWYARLRADGRAG